MNFTVGTIVHNVAGEGWLPVLNVPVEALPMWVLNTVPEAEVTADPGVTLNGIADKYTSDEHASLGDLAKAIASKWVDRKLIVLSVSGTNVFGLVKADGEFVIAMKSLAGNRCQSCDTPIA